MQETRLTMLADLLPRSNQNCPAIGPLRWLSYYCNFCKRAFMIFSKASRLAPRSGKILARLSGCWP